MKISIVVPCYNEQEVLMLHYEEMKKVMKIMKDVSFEIIYIDDGSSDNTLNILKDLHRIDTRCKYISFSRNYGKESAMYAGLEHSQGDYVAIMDADLQDPPTLLPKMYKILEEEDYDCVATRRADRKGEARIRSYLSEKFYKIINKVSETEIVDGARDFRLMNRKMVNAVLQMSEYNRFSKGIFSWVGFKTKYIEYENVERVAGTTSWSFMNLFKYSLEGIMAFSTFPLSLSIFFGILFCIISLLMLIIFGIVGFGTTSGVLTGAFFIGGIVLLCMGINGMYLAKTYLEVKNRPIYIVRETEKGVVER